MNNRTVLAFTLLLLVQSMSAAIHVLPQQHESDLGMEPLFETGARSNNSSSGCGYNASSFYISGWYSPMPAYAGDTVNATVFTDCNLLNQTMVVHYAISNSSTYLTSGNWSWTAMSLNDTHHVEVTNIPAGTYTMTADVYYGSSYAYLTSYNTTITVLANTTGGNGTGGNTGCGYNASSFYISGWYSPMPAYAGDTVNATVFTDCNLLNQTMVVHYAISNSSTYLTSGNWTWTAMSLNDTHYVEVTNVPAGTYTLTADVYYGSSYAYLASYNTTIIVFANTTGGNGTGGNTGCGYESAYASINAYSLTSSYSLGDTFTGTIHTYCAVLNHTMVLDWTVRNTGTNNTVDAGSFNWTAMQLYETHNVTSATLATQPVGNYIFEAQLSWYNGSQGMWETLHSIGHHFTVSNSTGGNGTGNTSGSNEYMDIDHSGYAYETADGLEVWTSGTDVEVAFESGNLSIGQNYSMVWWLWDNSGTNQITNGNASWIAYANVSIENHTISGLQDGTYHFEAALYNATGHSVGADFTTIQMGNNSGGNGTGNNTGGNGTGNNTGGNGTGNTSISNEYMDIDHSGYAYETEEGLEVWASGTDVEVAFESGNLTIGQNYSMSWWLWDNSGTNMIAEGNASWTAYANVSIENQTFSLMDGTYHIEAALYNATGHTVGADFTTIQVGNNTGGNGTGNNTNNTGCGTAWNMTYHTTQLSQSVYNLGDEVNWETGVDCIVQGTNYTMEYYLSLNSAGSVEDFGSESWTGNAIFLAFDEEYTLSTAASMAGSYTIVTNLYASDNSTLLHSESVGFTVMGNNNSGNNTGNNTGNNQTTLGYSLNTNAWNDCINGVLVVNMTFQDTGNLTGGQMTVYIDIWQGSNSNISGTNVTSFSNTVTFDPNSGMASMDWAVDLNAAGLANGDYVLYLSSAFTDMYSTTFTLGCTGCGYDPSFHSNSTTFWWEGGSIRENMTIAGVGSNSNQSLSFAYIGQEMYWSAMVGCAMYDTDYKFNMTLTDENDIIVDWDESIQNRGPALTSGSSSPNWWTSRVSDSGWLNTSNLSPGVYCIEITVHMEPYGSGDLIVVHTECFVIMSFDDYDGCGNNMTLVEHEQSFTGNPFVQQNLVFTEDSRIWVNNFVDCLVFGESYTMFVNVTNESGPYESFTHNFTLNSFGFFGFNGWNTLVNWNEDIVQGTYCSNVTVVNTSSDHMQIIAEIYNREDCFAVVASSTNDDWWDNQGNDTGSPNNPIMPDVNCSELNNTLGNLSGLTNTWNQTECENGTGFWFDVTVNGTNVTWYDPIYAVGYDYEIVSGPNVGSIIVPPGYGDNKFDLYLWQNGEFVLVQSDLDATVQYWFTDEGGISSSPVDNEGVRKFSIRGLELSAKLDPDDTNAFVTGMAFVQNPNEQASLVLRMTPITESDEDDDGIADDEDNCVNTINADQADADGDGVGDACEDGVQSDNNTDGTEDGGGAAVMILATLIVVALGFVAVSFFRKK